MADEDDDQDSGGGDEDGAAPSEKGGKKKLLIIVGVIFLLIVGGVAAAYFTGLLDPVLKMIVGKDTGATEESSGGQAGHERGIFYDLQELLINLNTGGRKSRFLKIRVSLELASEADKPKLEGVMPRIIDNFQTYLRELRIDDLKGSAGMYRLREELLIRVNAAAAPVKIKDVLFKEMLIQ